jgi:hypothetical protein
VHRLSLPVENLDVPPRRPGTLKPEESQNQRDDSGNDAPNGAASRVARNIGGVVDRQLLHAHAHPWARVCGRGVALDRALYRQLELLASPSGRFSGRNHSHSGKVPSAEADRTTRTGLTVGKETPVCSTALSKDDSIHEDTRRKCGKTRPAELRRLQMHLICENLRNLRIGLPHEWWARRRDSIMAV